MPQDAGVRAAPVTLSSNVTVSIVTVCLNAAESLESTIKSVIGQDLREREYVILDGGSTDRSAAIIEKYEDRLAYWQSEPDQGVYHAMNKAVGQCKGEWILFMNAGDSFFAPDSLSRMFGHVPDEAEVIYGHHFYAIAGREPKYRAAADFDTTWSRLQRGDLSFDWLVGIPAHQSTAVRRRLLAKLKFDTGFRIAADHDLLFRARREGAKFFHCNEVISLYAGGGMSAKNYSLCKQEWAQIARKYGNPAAADRFYARLERKEARELRDRWLYLRDCVTRLHSWLKAAFSGRPRI